MEEISKWNTPFINCTSETQKAVTKISCKNRGWYRLGLPYVKVFLDMSSLSGFRVASRGLFNFPKSLGFWLLLIVALNFFVVITYIKFHSSRRPRFNLRTYFHSVPVDLNASSQSLVPVIHFELSAMQWRLCCMIFRLCIFLSCSYKEEKKT